MTLPLELRGRKGAGGAEAPAPLPAAASPSRDSYLLHSSVWFSVFIFHVLSRHERGLFPPPRRGRLRSALGSRRDEAGAGGRGQPRFKASKQPAQPEAEYFPGGRGCSLLSSPPKHAALHERDQRTPANANVGTFGGCREISAVISVRVLKSLPHLKCEPAVVDRRKIISTLICNEHHVIRTS